MAKKNEPEVQNERLIEKEREIQKLRGEIEMLTEELVWARNKLADAQIRLRRLNWIVQQNSGEMNP